MPFRVLLYFILLMVGIGVYYGIDYLPESWRARLVGNKANIVGWSAIILPEAVDILTQIDALGLVDWVPGPYGKIFSQVVGVLTLVARYRTRLETGA